MKAKIRNRYNQVPHPAYDRTWESDKSTRKHHTQESQGVSPVPTGNHKAAINLGWQSLENRNIDTRLATFYIIIYGLVAVPLPSYFEHPEVYTRHMYSLSYRQIHTSVCSYKYSFFPISIVLWNRLPADLVLVPDLDPFKTGVSKVNPRGGGGVT